MIDPFGRAITYLRVSVTDRCDLRCVYCMSEDMSFLPKADVLSLEELDRLCSAFILLGARKIRITGGEPLVRRDVQRLFEIVTELDVGVVELGVSVHGHRADAIIRDQAGRLRPVLLDTGPLGSDDDPARHLRRTLQRTALLGGDAVRVPAWRLFAEPAWLREQLTY